MAAATKKKSPNIKTKTKSKAPAIKKPRQSPLTRKSETKIYKVTEIPKPAPLLSEKDSVASEIMSRIRGALAPTNLMLKSLTEAHKKHKEAQKSGGGHYALSVVSEVFSGLSLKQRQQWIYNLVSDLMGKSIHALQLDLKEPREIPLREDNPIPFKAPRPEAKQSSKKQRS